VQRVHFFTQLHWLRSSYPSVCNLKVVRHGDRQALGLVVLEAKHKASDGEGLGRNLKELLGLAELVIELETMERDKDQLRLELLSSSNT